MINKIKNNTELKSKFVANLKKSINKFNTPSYLILNNHIIRINNIERNQLTSFIIKNHLRFLNWGFDLFSNEVTFSFMVTFKYDYSNFWIPYIIKFITFNYNKELDLLSL